MCNFFNQNVLVLQNSWYPPPKKSIPLKTISFYLKTSIFWESGSLIVLYQCIKWKFHQITIATTRNYFDIYFKDYYFQNDVFKECCHWVVRAGHRVDRCDKRVIIAIRNRRQVSKLYGVVIGLCILSCVHLSTCNLQIA